MFCLHVKVQYIKCHYIQIKVIDLIFKIIWKSFFYVELKKALTKVFRLSLDRQMWNGRCGISRLDVERQQLPVKLLVLVAGQYCQDNKRIHFISKFFYFGPISEILLVEAASQVKMYLFAKEHVS